VSYNYNDMDISVISSALKILQKASARSLALALPIRFRVAYSSEEREAVYRLRYSTAVKQGWARPEDFPDRLEYDDYDEKALQIVGCNGTVPMATVRMVFPEPGRLLPTEKIYDLEIEPRGRVIDMGREVVVPVNRRHHILTALLCFAWDKIVTHGFTDVCGIISPASLRIHKRIGLKATILASARRYWGEERLPVRFEVLDSAITVAKWVRSICREFGE